MCVQKLYSKFQHFDMIHFRVIVLLVPTSHYIHSILTMVWRTKSQTVFSQDVILYFKNSISNHNSLVLGRTCMVFMPPGNSGLSALGLVGKGKNDRKLIRRTNKSITHECILNATQKRASKQTLRSKYGMETAQLVRSML